MIMLSHTIDKRRQQWNTMDRGGHLWIEINSDGYRWIQVVSVTKIFQHAEHNGYSSETAYLLRDSNESTTGLLRDQWLSYLAEARFIYILYRMGIETLLPFLKFKSCAEKTNVKSYISLVASCWSHFLNLVLLPSACLRRFGAFNLPGGFPGVVPLRSADFFISTLVSGDISYADVRQRLHTEHFILEFTVKTSKLSARTQFYQGDK